MPLATTKIEKYREIEKRRKLKKLLTIRILSRAMLNQNICRETPIELLYKELHIYTQHLKV